MLTVLLKSCISEFLKGCGLGWGKNAKERKLAVVSSAVCTAHTHMKSYSQNFTGNTFLIGQSNCTVHYILPENNLYPSTAKRERGFYFNRTDGITGKPRKI